MIKRGRATLVVGLSLITVACGKKGPLIYPDMLVPAAPAAVTAQQSGSTVKLQFVLPDKDRAGRQGQGVSGVKISRRIVEAGQNSCRSCLTDYMLFRTVYLDHLPAHTQRFGNRLIVIDADVSAGTVYTYRIVPFTSNRVDGAPALTDDVPMTAPRPAPELKIQSYPTEVKLQIYSHIPISGSLYGYNMYRWPATTTRSYQPLNREPLKGEEYVDSRLERGVKYRYAVRELTVLSSGNIVESAESNEVEGMLKDDE